MNSKNRTKAPPHLAQEAMLRLQVGEATEAERAHLAQCAECQEKTQPLSEALSCFGAAARQWGEEKATMALEWREAKDALRGEWQESRAAAPRRRRGMIGSWAAVAVILILLFSIGVPRWRAHRAEAALQAQEQHQQELARDNALLDAVDQDVSQEVPSPLEPLSWSTATANSSGTGAAKVARQ